MKKHERKKIDEYVGAQLRTARQFRGMSQQELAAQIELTFQQVQKYERGTNRISASVLYEFSQILEIPVEQFYAGLSTGTKIPLPMLGKDHERLIHFYNEAPKSTQKCLLKLLEAIANGGGNA